MRTAIILGFFFITLSPATVSAQMTGLGSTSVYNSTLSVSVGSTLTEYAETVYIGPDADLQIDGELVVYGKNIWIAPDAKIKGNGAITIANPEDNPYYTDMPAGQTTIDGNNGRTLAIIIRHQNPNNIVLDDIMDPGYGTINPSGALSAALNIGNTFFFEVDDGDILLNGNDLILRDRAELGNYFANRFVVTGNSIEGHLVKINDGFLSVTTFPVGISEGDFTPAAIVGAADYSVSVTNYAAAEMNGVDINNEQEGMDRAWHIYGGAADELYLQHNSAIASTDGISYVDANAFITRYFGAGNWSTGTPEQLIPGYHWNAGGTAGGIPSSDTAAGAWVSKTSDAITPLPLKLTTFQAYKKDAGAELKWVISSKFGNTSFDVQHSIDGGTWASIGLVRGAGIEKGNAELAYSYMHVKPGSGQNFYRLKLSDVFGEVEYSPVRNVWIDDRNEISIYPNPARSKLAVSGLSGCESICIFDLSGRLVYRSEINEPALFISLDHLCNGTYQISIFKKNGSAAFYIVEKI